VSGYHLPLCDHIEKLLKPPAHDIDEMLLDLIKESYFCMLKEEKIKFENKRPYLTQKICVNLKDDAISDEIAILSERGSAPILVKRGQIS